MTPEQPKTQTLYNRTPPRDAVYILALHRTPEGLWVTTYQNGRRGNNLPDPKPVKPAGTYAQALAAFAAKEAEKRGGGYHEPEYYGEGAPAGTGHTAAAQAAPQETGIFPLLLTEIEEADVAALIADPAWSMEEKFDGKRIIGEATDKGGRGINRKSRVVLLPEYVRSGLEALAAQTGGLRVDGELLPGQGGYVIFDALHLGPLDLTPQGYRLRRTALAHSRLQLPPAIRVGEVYYTAEEKAAAFERLRREGAEGVVFKRTDAPYEAGRPGTQRKFCFRAHASFVVTRINATEVTGKRAGKQSFGVSFYVDGAWTEVGNVTVPPNKEMPAVGQIVDVRYKYAHRGGCLIQPFYTALRDDIDASDVQAQPALKYKGEGSEEEDD
jgi:bifunctional non-homologous end joining protein LigD